MTFVPGKQMESSFFTNDDDSNDNNESEMYLIVDEDLPELSDENAPSSTSAEQQCSSFSSSNLDSSPTLAEVQGNIEEKLEDPQFVVKESCDCSPPSSSNKITTMMKLKSGSKEKQKGNVKAYSAVNGVRTLTKSKPFKRRLKFFISQKKTYECLKKGNVKAKGTTGGVRIPTKSEPLKKGVKLIFSRKKTYESLLQSSKSRSLPKSLSSLLKNQSAQINANDTKKTENASCESQKSFGNRSECTTNQSSKKDDTWLRQVKFKEQQLHTLHREEKAQRSADDKDGTKNSAYESQKLFGNWSKHTPTSQTIQTDDTWLQQELLKEQRSNRLLREENMILSQNLSYYMSSSSMDSHDNHSALQSQDNTYNDIHNDNYSLSPKTTNSWNPRTRVVRSKSKPVQKRKKKKTLVRKNSQTKNMNCHNGQKMFLSPDPKKALLPDPNKTLLPDPNRVLLPDPKKVLLPDPNKTLLPDPNIFLLPDPNNIFLPEQNKFLLPDPNTNLLAAPNKFLLPVPNKVLLPDPNKILPETNKVLLPNPNKVLLPNPNEFSLSNPNQVLLPDPNQVLLPEPKKGFLPEPKKCLLPDPRKGLSPDHKPSVPVYSSQLKRFKRKRRLRRKTTLATGKSANLPGGNTIPEIRKYSLMSDSKKVSLPEPNKFLLSEPKKVLLPEPSKGLLPEPKKFLLSQPKKVLLPEPSKGLLPEPKKFLLSDPKKILFPEPSKGLLPDPNKGLLPDHKPSTPVYSSQSKRYNRRFRRKTSLERGYKGTNLPVDNAIQEIQRYSPMPEPNRVLLPEPNKVLLPDHKPPAPVYSSQSERYNRDFSRKTNLGNTSVDNAARRIQRYSTLPERYLSESDRSSFYRHTGSFQDTYRREPFHLLPSDEFY